MFEFLNKLLPDFDFKIIDQLLILHGVEEFVPVPFLLSQLLHRIILYEYTIIAVDGAPPVISRRPSVWRIEFTSLGEWTLTFG